MAGNFVGASNQYIDITGTSAINNGVISFTFKGSNSGLLQVPFGSDDGTANNVSWASIGGSMTGAWANESLAWQCLVGGGNYLIFAIRKGEDYYQDGAWHRAIVRCDGSDNAMFVDGVKETISFLAGNATTANGFFPNNTNFSLASSPWHLPSSINGQLDDICLYTVGLSDSECIAITSGNGNDGIVRGLQNHWRMDEASAGQTITTAQDLYNDQDGSGVNNPTYIGSPIRTLRSR